jgi:endonuclease/exonuclease/phosphatase (EEP) superfamily protein YafD
MCLHGPLATGTGRIEVRRGVSGVVALLVAVAALLVAVAALPPLVARAKGGQPPGPGAKLAALAPLAALPAVIAMAIAATVSCWLALLLAYPAATLVAWQLPPPRRPSRGAARRQVSDAGPGVVTLRLLTLNAKGGSADPAAVLSSLRRHRVDVLAVQELTPTMVRRLEEAGVASLLPFCHLDPRPRSPGVGLWARWPLDPLPPLPGLMAAAPRARIVPASGWPVTVSAVHPIAPTRGHEHEWRRDLGLIKSALAGGTETQVVAGDFNASRDHRPFRELLAAGFVDCADAALSRPWPGFTWPADRRIPPVMRLDHVLVSRAGAAVLEARIIRVPGTDHCGVLAVIEFRPAA